MKTKYTMLLVVIREDGEVVNTFSNNLHHFEKPSADDEWRDLAEALEKAATEDAAKLGKEPYLWDDFIADEDAAYEAKMEAAADTEAGLH